jgi:tetratricopeptide (TPR) repeat protein
MLRPKKKISKKEIKEDRLITWYAEATGLYEKHKKNIHIGIGAVAIILLAVVVYVKNRNDNEVIATAQLAKVFSLFDAGSYKEAVDGIPERNIPGLKSIVDNYGSTPSGEIARFYLANSLYALRRYDEAIQEFEDFSPSDDLLAISRYAGIAQCHEVKGEYAEAAKAFELAASKNPNDLSAAENLNSAARNYALAGNKEKALDLYRRLKKTHSATPYGREADRYIAQLSA